MNSSNKNESHVLATKPLSTRSKRLLESIANLPDDHTSGLRLLHNNFPYVLADLPSRFVQKEATFDDGASYPYFSVTRDMKSKYKCLLLPLRNRLRVLWRLPDRHAKLLGMLRIEQDFFLQGDERLQHDPLCNEWDFHLTQRPPSRTERLLLQFLDLADYARMCTGSDCTSPYFIASRRSQKYCSPRCARESQREFKRRWWANNGTQWRAARVARRKTKRH